MRHGVITKFKQDLMYTVKADGKGMGKNEAMILLLLVN